MTATLVDYCITPGNPVKTFDSRKDSGVRPPLPSELSALCDKLAVQIPQDRGFFGSKHPKDVVPYRRLMLVGPYMEGYTSVCLYLYAPGRGDFLLNDLNHPRDTEDNRGLKTAINDMLKEHDEPTLVLVYEGSKEPTLEVLSSLSKNKKIRRKKLR